MLSVFSPALLHVSIYIYVLISQLFILINVQCFIHLHFVRSVTLPYTRTAQCRWLPANLQDLPSKSAHSYDPRIYKTKLCDRHPTCPFGIYCTFAHTERERDLSIKFRDQLHEYLLARNAVPSSGSVVSIASKSPSLNGSTPTPAPRVTGPLRPLQASRPRRLVSDQPETVCRICWNSSAINDTNGTVV